jgi:hypothetical protein
MDAGIVHKDVNPIEFVHHAMDGVCNLLPVTNVTAH